MLTLIQQYGEKVDDVIGGGMVEEEKPDELNSGAKIRKIFNERLPLAIVQVERNDKQLRKQIRITIQNILGVSSGLFTPDKAFDKIARQEIEKLRGPSLNIVDLVVTEYMGFLRERTKSMKAYPRLEEEVERIVAMRIRDQEQDCKTHINYSEFMEDFQGVPMVFSKNMFGQKQLFSVNLRICQVFSPLCIILTKKLPFTSSTPNSHT